MPDSKAKREWDAANTVFVGLKLNSNTDSDIIRWLATQPSKQGAIKNAIRATMHRMDDHMSLPPEWLKSGE